MQPFDPRVVWGQPIPHDQPVGGANERCIEVPLGLEVLALDTYGRVLDAGCALNGQIHERAPVACVWHLTQNIASEVQHVDVPTPVSYISADLRNLNAFADRAFHRTVCISTLEHVGLDNTTYGAPVEDLPQTMLRAVHELMRVTRTDLLITVPFCRIPTACPQWRFLHLGDVAQMVMLAEAHGYTTQIRYYGKAQDGGWFGGTPEPVVASQTGFPDSVNAIVCLRCTR